MWIIKELVVFFRGSLRQIVLDIYRSHQTVDKENLKPSSSANSQPISTQHQPLPWQHGSEHSCGGGENDTRLMDFDDIVTEPEDNFENFEEVSRFNQDIQLKEESRFEEDSQRSDDNEDGDGLDCARLALPDLTITFNELSEMEQDRQIAIQTLVAAEQRFVTLMQAGIQSYSRPLRHCILASAERTTLFQNVEKLVAISEFHLRQMDTNSLSYAEPDCSGEFLDEMGSIYVPKVVILCEAYEQYCNGLEDALRLLTDLQRYREFQNFLQRVWVQHLSIDEFLHKPLEHLREMTSQMAVILSHTRNNHHDYASLQKCAKGKYCPFQFFHIGMCTRK